MHVSSCGQHAAELTSETCCDKTLLIVGVYRERERDGEQVREKQQKDLGGSSFQLIPDLEIHSVVLCNLVCAISNKKVNKKYCCK